MIPGTGIRRDGGAEPQSLVSVPSLPGLNFNSLGNKYDVKAYVLLIAIRPSDGDVKPDGPFRVLEYESTIAGTGILFVAS